MEKMFQEASEISVQATTPPVFAETVSLPIDHFGKTTGNFSNRFWVVDQYYKPGGPVFAFDTGESNGGDTYLGYLTNSQSFVNKYLQHFNGLGIVWEHRYYGESAPFPINLNTTAEQLQWLTAENALKDFDIFANQFQWANFSNVDFSPSITPWVVIGGSYPGMRAAMLRYFFPETVFASYAASPPLEAMRNMSIYYEQVYRGMVAYGLGNCTDNIRRALNYIDSQLDEPETAAAIKIKFLGRTAEKNSNGGFVDTLQIPFFDWQGSGVDDLLNAFCDALEFANVTDIGTTGHVTDKVLAERWAAWPDFIDLVNELQPGGFCEGPVPQNKTTPDCELELRFTDVLSISWTWQYCTQWGYLQAANLGPHTLGSRYETLEHQQSICFRQFPDGLSSGLLPPSPKTEQINSETDGWAMRPSQVMFTEGEFDPWRTLSPLSNESFSEHFQVTQDIPACGVSTAADTVFGFVLANAQHCYDFNPVATYPPAAVPNDLFQSALTEWLQCFGQNNTKTSAGKGIL